MRAGYASTLGPPYGIKICQQITLRIYSERFRDSAASGVLLLRALRAVRQSDRHQWSEGTGEAGPVLHRALRSTPSLPCPPQERESAKQTPGIEAHASPTMPGPFEYD